MSFLRKRFKDLSNRKNIISSRIDHLDEKLTKINDELSSLISKVFIDEQLLYDTYWDIDIDSYDNQVFLTYDKKHGDNQLEEKISFLFKDNIIPDYSDVFQIDKEETPTLLEVNNKQIIFVFSNIKKAKDFVVKNNMIVNRQSIDSRLDKLRLPLIELEKISHIFNDIKK